MTYFIYEICLSMGEYYSILRLDGSLDLIINWWANSQFFNRKELLMTKSSLTCMLKLESQSNPLYWLPYTAIMSVTTPYCSFHLWYTTMYCTQQILDCSWYTVLRTCMYGRYEFYILFWDIKFYKNFVNSTSLYLVWCPV